MKFVQAELAIDIPYVAPVSPTVYVVRAYYAGRGRYSKHWKTFGHEFMTETSAVKFANDLGPGWVKRKVYRLD